MKTQQKILTAFILNLTFSFFELAGGFFTGSVAILSDAFHDFGDAASIGISFFLEKKSNKQPDEKYTYGYARFSVMGGLITTLILLIGSVLMIYNAAGRIITPAEINCNGMIGFAVVGFCVNLCAAFFTHKGDSLNQKAVNLHMLEDTLGWAAVLFGAVVMRFTGFTLLDPIMSICTSAFIFINATKNLKKIAELFLEKVPRDIDVSKIKEQTEKIEGIIDVHHVHVRSFDGHNHFASMHVVTDSDESRIKAEIRTVLSGQGIVHVTIETEKSSQVCLEKNCSIKPHDSHCHHCH